MSFAHPKSRVLAVLLAVLTIPVAAITSHQAAAQPSETCNGLVATIVGTSGDDVLTRSHLDDVIVGLGGNDIIDGKSGVDTICGGDGDDTIKGGSQVDTIFGDAGADHIDGGSGADTIDGGDGNDVINGKSQTDTISGGEGDDTINGASGNDIIDGGPGDDIIDASHGGDTVTAGPGDDTIDGGTGHDTLNGGPGTDSIDGGFGNDTCIAAETNTNCETIEEGDGDPPVDDEIVVESSLTADSGEVVFRAEVTSEVSVIAVVDVVGRFVGMEPDGLGGYVASIDWSELVGGESYDFSVFVERPDSSEEILETVTVEVPERDEGAFYGPLSPPPGTDPIEFLQLAADRGVHGHRCVSRSTGAPQRLLGGVWFRWLR